ncbi:MAG: cytochrome ubiquinol oxidase subunit I [Desulfovibrionaceae bacterium]
MDVIMLSRLQFAVAVFFHFIFVPLTLGLSVLLAYMETRYVATGDEMWKRMAQFWGKLFIINFTLGVVTGITLEFQFGTNWSRYSEYVGDIFGSLLAIEATVAFFLESTFLAIWAFGWNKVGKKTHLFAIWMVAIASNISAIWIILANGWMQNPVGYVIRNGRAELDNFFTVITNPYAWGQFLHNNSASWMLAGFFVLGISAWHLVRNSHVEFFRRSFKVAAPFTLVMALLMALTGHQQGMAVAQYQPVKLAAMESLWEGGKDLPLSLIVIPNRAEKKNAVEALPIPGLLSWLSYGDTQAEVKGLNDFPESDWPPISSTFYSFRLMVAFGGVFLLLACIAFFIRNNKDMNPTVLRMLTWIIPFPYVAIAFGWTVAEVGRQPWIVYGLMRTNDAVSPVPAGNVAISLVAFIVVYSMLGLVDIYLLRKNALKGPAA